MTPIKPTYHYLVGARCFPPFCVIDMSFFLGVSGGVKLMLVLVLRPVLGRIRKGGRANEYHRYIPCLFAWAGERDGICEG